MPVLPAAGDYWELSIPVSAETSEGVTNFLWELGALGVIEEVRPTTRGPHLRAFYPAATEPAALADRVRAYVEGLSALGFPTGSGPEVVGLADADWGEAWRQHFKPLVVGRRLVIAPPWERPNTSERRVVVIDPGRAFGTGHHATTQGCLEALETLLEEQHPAHGIDLGTGSGVLALAATTLGVGRMLAVDTDPDAVAAAEANAVRNGLADRVRCVMADAASVQTEAAPLVTANLLTAAHLALAGRYPTLLTPGGTLVLGGILAREADAVLTALREHGLILVESRTLDDWTTLTVTRRPCSART